MFFNLHETNAENHENFICNPFDLSIHATKNQVTDYNIYCTLPIYGCTTKKSSKLFKKCYKTDMTCFKSKNEDKIEEVA